MPFTVNKKLSVQSAGSNPGTWGAGGVTGNDLNTGVMGPVDTQLAGVSTFSVSSSNVSLTFSDVQNCIWRFTGTLTASIVVSPAAGDATTYLNGFYFWSNLTTGNFSITVTTANGSVVLPQGRQGLLFVSATAPLAPTLFAITDPAGTQPIPSGTVMPFYQSAAPTGWTIVSGVNDCAFKVSTSAPGVISGSVAYSTLFGRTSVDGYTLQIADIPPHSHNSVALGVYNGSQPLQSGSNFSGNSAFPATSSTGGGGSHTHTIDMRVQTAAVLLASKN